MRGNKLFVLPILATLIIASMAAVIVPVRATPPPPEDHYVDGYTAGYTGWTAVGTSPYLSAPDDGSYVEGTTDGALMGWFTFTDIAPLGPTYVIDHVWLEGYTNGPLDTGVDYDVYNGAGAWLGSLYGNDSPQWVRMRWIAPDDPTDNTDASLLTEAGFNAFRVTLWFYDPGGVGGAGNIVDSLRLHVTFKEKPMPPYPFMIVNPAMTIAPVGTSFDVNIEIPGPPYTPVYDLYGFEFKLRFNPAVVQGVGTIVKGPFFPITAIEWANVIDNVEGYAWYSLTMPFGAPKGVNGYGVLAKITFTMVYADPVITALTLDDTLMGNRYATPIFHGVESGIAMNTEDLGLDLSVSITTAHVETQKWSASGDADGLVGLEAALKNDGEGITETKARFAIFDQSGLLIDVVDSIPILTAPHDTPLVGIKWGGWSLYSAYKVEVTVLYTTADGWVTGMKGSASGSRDVMVVHFRTQP